MKSTEFQSKVAKDGAASFWLQRQMQAVCDRDVLDALIDAEALAVFCELRAKEAGINLPIRQAKLERREWCRRCEAMVPLTEDGEACAHCKLVL